MASVTKQFCFSNLLGLIGSTVWSFNSNQKLGVQLLGKYFCIKPTRNVTQSVAAHCLAADRPEFPVFPSAVLISVRSKV